MKFKPHFYLKNSLIVSLLFGVSFQVFSQNLNRHKVDSVLGSIHSKDQNINKKSYDSLGKAIFKLPLKEAISLFEYSISKTPTDYGRLRLYINYDKFLAIKNELDAEIEIGGKGLALSIKLNDVTNQVNFAVKIATSYIFKSMPDKAFPILNEAETLALKNEDQSLLGSIYYSKAMAYESIENFDEATKNYLKAWDYYKENDEEKGFFLYVMVDYFTKKKLPVEQAKFTEELIAYYADKTPNVPINHLPINKIFKSTEDANNISHYKAVIKASDSLRSIHAMVYSSFTLADIYTKINQPKKAIETLQTVERKLDSLHNSQQLLDVYLKLSVSNAKTKNYKEAYRYRLLESNLRDTITSEKMKKNIVELETKYQTQQKEQEITLLKSQKELSEQQKANQRNVLLGGIGLTSMAGLFFFFLYRNRQKTTKKLRELDTFKSKLFANISHEFRTPLTLISGPIDKRLNNDKLNEDDRNEFTMIQRNSNRLLNLVNQLLDLSKLESGRITLKVAQGNLSALLKSMASSFQHIASQKNINYNSTVEELKEVWFDKDVVEKTVINLLSNAFKYTPDNGTITFKVSNTDDQIKLSIENDGNTLTKKQIDHIFNRFYQADDTAEGVGIGLSLVKELVMLSHGSISVENTSDTSLAFTVLLPKHKTQFKPDELFETAMQEPLAEHKTYFTETETIAAQTIDEDLPILLVVDDEEDIRSFIKSAFKDAYQVVEANDGEMGIEKAIALVPDIIISDVMMPNKNGFELTSQLKQDERTSHIPIILLTAKVEDADKFLGLETGADDYIIKPFKIKGLEARVKNLIASREKLRQRYSQELILRPKDIAITNFDEKFLEKLQVVIDEKLIESSFNVEDFSKALSMSRMQLHRKLKALTGLSATEFIRSQRLKLAADLLKKSDANMSEIGYAVGFNDPSYFTKCFKEAYGCLPSEYASKS